MCEKKAESPLTDGFQGYILDIVVNITNKILQKGGPNMFMINRVNAMTLMTAPSAFLRLR